MVCDYCLFLHWWKSGLNLWELIKESIYIALRHYPPYWCCSNNCECYCLFGDVMHGLNFYTKFQIPQIIILLMLALFLIDYVWFICHWTSHGLSQKKKRSVVMTAHAQAWWGVPRGGRVNGGLRAVQEEGREQGEAAHSPAGLNTHRHCHTQGNNGCPACVWLSSSDILGVRAVSEGGGGEPHNGRRYERKRLHWTFLALVFSFFLLLLRNWTVVLLTKRKEACLSWCKIRVEECEQANSNMAQLMLLHVLWH